MSEETNKVYLAENFFRNLVLEEKSQATIQKYRRGVLQYLNFLAGKNTFTKEDTIRFKGYLQATGAAVSTINGTLIAVNRFLRFSGYAECCVRLLRVQKKAFCDKKREISRTEYLRLLEEAKRKGDRRLYLVLQTICSTGIRVSELQHITVEAVRVGRAVVNCKGKSRVILLPHQLCTRLQKWIKTRRLVTGPVFVTKNDRPLDRSNIWRMMKRLCKSAGVNIEKVFPHNLRHLFAKTFYAMDKDLAKLADVLGHSSIETTRIYIAESGWQHERLLAGMRLIM